MRIILIFGLICSLFGYELFWRVVSSGGQMGERLGSTAGQTGVNNFESPFDGIWGFWVDESCEICFEEIRPTWILDSVDVHTTYILDELIPITSCGNCPLALGMRFISSEPLSWLPAHTSSLNRFVLKAHFVTDSSDVPVFSIDDDIMTTILWSDEGHFGGEFFDEIIYLGLALTTPDGGSTHGRNQIVAEISGRIPLP